MRLMPIALLCLVAALLQVHLLQMACPALEQSLIDNLKTFHTNLPVYRSRLLTITLVRILGGDLQAYLAVIFFSLLVGGLLSWRLYGGGGLAIYHVGFAFFAAPWFQPWDCLGATLFTAFVILVVEGWPVAWFMGLFAIAILDRQSAMFMALWMVLSGRMVWSGLACGAFGLLLMYYFQHTGQPNLGLNLMQGRDGFSRNWTSDYAFIVLPENLRQLLVLPINWLAKGTIVVTAAAALHVMQTQVALGLMFLALLVATLTFGSIDELRVWLPFIPLFIVAVKE